MRIVLFCEQRYAISILKPIQEEALHQGEHDLLWYVEEKNIPDFTSSEGVSYTTSIQEIYDFNPEVIFVPCNIVPYYLPGVKVQIFHGYAAEKKDHWVIRRYFDLYLTQGPFFTQGFETLAKKYGDFEVIETGWPRQDWIYHNLHTYDDEKKRLLENHGRHKMVLYAPTFSPSLTSLPHMAQALAKLAEQEDVLILLKFHPLTAQEFIDQYKKLADQHVNILWVDDNDITQYQLMADVMISDTSSTVYEFLLLDKPVITYKTAANDIYWINIEDTDDLSGAYHIALTDKSYQEKRKWIIANYDPYLDGKVAARMLNAVKSYIAKHGVPKYRKLNLWRQYESIRKFGRIKR